ncbi:MAG: DtxR family transcriptional regulator [Phycisphaerales bacterium]|nr:DtxR family transcriptional regulator [Phycisphaerales bacterium]
MGPLTWWSRIREARRRVLIEDALKHLHACEWRGHRATIDSLAGAIGIPSRAVVRLCQHIEAQGWLRSTAGGVCLTPDGTRMALQVIRAHRLWERYLADEARMPLTSIHAVADRREHRRTPRDIQALEAAMGYPTTDPHGDPIPTADGRLPDPASKPLTEWPTDVPAVIVHLEDEPAAVFSQLAAEGLRPGQRIKVIEADAARIVFADDRETYTLAPIIAANVFVGPAAPITTLPFVTPLTTLKRGQDAIVHELDDTLRGFTRRRLLDLGLTPGAVVTSQYTGFLGDPTAYRVRGSLIALRRDQAQRVLIRPAGSSEQRHG